MTWAQQEHLRITKEATAKGLAEGRAIGRAKGLAEAILQVLRARGLRVTHAVRQKVTACADAKLLSRWLKRAAVVQHLDDLFT